MNWDRIAGQWKQVKGSIRERWGDLTDDHIDQAAGQRARAVEPADPHTAEVVLPDGSPAER